MVEAGMNAAETGQRSEKHRPGTKIALGIQELLPRWDSAKPIILLNAGGLGTCLDIPREPLILED